MLDEDRDINPYLQQEVLSASPVRLRWMLITRAMELCEGVQSLWAEGQLLVGDQWALRIREILGELLSGVTEGNPASQKVADFYTFLLAKLADVQRTRDAETLSTLRDLLSYEADTWKLLLDKPLSDPGEPHQAFADSNAANLKAGSSQPLRTHLPAPLSSSYDDSGDFSAGSSFSLDV